MRFDGPTRLVEYDDWTVHDSRSLLDLAHAIGNVVYHIFNGTAMFEPAFGRCNDSKLDM